VPADEEVSIDFLQLVRLGLRGADDARIQDSIKMVDALLKADTPNGPVWHRYNGDGYGEHDDGRPFDGTGRGRAWPLLAGERGHFELVAGNDPLPYLKAMAAMTGPSGMIPEQVWDSAAVPERRLFPGRPTRCGYAVGLGPCGVHQAADLTPSWIPGRPARIGVAALWRPPLCIQARGLVLARAHQPDRTRHRAHNRVTARGTGPLGYERLADCRRR
jgi:hypothetical protein